MASIMGANFGLVAIAERWIPRLMSLTGRFTSKRFSYAAPTGDFLRRIRDHYGPDVYPEPQAPKPY